jgi:hypothetical protein
MKMCPQCGRMYADDLTFCLQDGSVLAPEPPEAAGEEPTVVRAPRRTEPAVAHPRPASSSAGWLKWAIPAVLLLIVAAVVAIAAVLLLRPMLVPSTNEQAAVPANTNSRQQRPAENRPAFPSSSPSPTPAKTGTPAKNDEPHDNRDPGPSTTPDVGEDRFTDPGPARITFRRGAVGDTVAGRIAKERSFVLQTIAGQRLSAQVRSAGNCVEFSGGGTSTGFSTSQGDSRVTIVNICDRPARFTLSITVR